MKAEPYIITKGPRAEEIYWVREGDECADGEEWGEPYADFEREKLVDLKSISLEVDFEMETGGFGYRLKVFDKYVGLQPKFRIYYSFYVIRYTTNDWHKDSESNRLLKRAEFLKAVCEREGIEWLPKPTDKQEKCNDCQACRDYYTKAEIDDRFEMRERMAEQMAAILSTVKQQGFDLKSGTIVVGDDSIHFTSDAALKHAIESKAEILAARSLAIFVESDKLKKLIRKMVRSAKRAKR